MKLVKKNPIHLWSIGLLMCRFVSRKNGPGKLWNKKSWSERRALWWACGMFGCDQSMKTQNSLVTEKNFWRTFFRGPIFAGTSFPRPFLGGLIFLGPLFPGIIFPGIFSPGDHVSRDHFSGDHLSWDLFSRGPFFQGPFFRGPFFLGPFFSGIIFPWIFSPGDHFSRDHFSWDHVSRGFFFLGTIFPGTIYPGTFFSRGPFSQVPFCRVPQVHRVDIYRVASSSRILNSTLHEWWNVVMKTLVFRKGSWLSWVRKTTSMFQSIKQSRWMTFSYIINYRNGSRKHIPKVTAQFSLWIFVSVYERTSVCFTHLGDRKIKGTHID